MTPIDHTQDSSTRNWLASAQAPGCDFPLHLPCGVFRRAGSTTVIEGGVALGDQVISLHALAASGLLQGLALRAAQAASGPVLNSLLALGRPGRRCATRCLRCSAKAVLRRRCRLLCWCRRRRWNTRCRWSLATRPTSTPPSTTR